MIVLMFSLVTWGIARDKLRWHGFMSFVLFCAVYWVIGFAAKQVM